MTIFAGSPRLLRSVGPFVAIVVLQALLAAFSMETLSSVRAYVAGESLWSKGQKGAVYALTLYAESGEEAHYRQYLATISVPMGDRMARRALEQAEPDIATAFQGFLQGGNQREDIAGMIWLFRYFGDIGHLKTAVDRWRDTDAVIEDLLNLGVEIHLDIVGGGIEPGRIEEFKRQIHQVNDRTTPLAVAFSESLGNGSRWITRLLLVINLFTATLLVLLGVWRIRSLLIERHGFEAALAAEKERLAFQANHDDLTGLANRRELEQQLAHVLPQVGSASCRHVLMFLDLDQFKVVNDTCGHAAGDRLLRQLSGALKQCLRAEDLLARLGGDEFAVLLVNCSPDNAAVVAEKLRRMVQDLKFVSSGRAFDITVSIGVVCITESDSTVENVLRAADIACYIAKENGRNRVEIYSPSDAELQRRVGEMSWVQRIQAALEDDRFCLHAQRIVPLSDGAEKELHLELLLRLQDEDGRLVAPGNFIRPPSATG